MLGALWIATALGLAGGLALALAAGKAVLPRILAKSPDLALYGRLAFAGAAVALLPALFLSIVVGGTLGGAWGEDAFAHLGVPSSGVPVGLAVGIALVFAAVLLAGIAVGIAIGKAVVFFRQRRMRH